MADMLKITTPLISRNEINPAKAVPEPDAPPFNITELGKVIPANVSSEILKNHTGLIDKDGKPTILMNLLKDPAVTVSFLKNIYVLQEIIKLLSMNNQSFTEEIQKMFEAMMLEPDKIAQEMSRQEEASTSFRGNLFDFLRDTIKKQPDNEVRLAVADLLKAVNQEMKRGDILDSIRNNLNVLRENFSASKNISERLDSLIKDFGNQNASAEFESLKKETGNLLNDIEDSILYNAKNAQLVSITRYNLSRFNSNPDYFREAVRNLMVLLRGSEPKNELINKANSFINELRRGEVKNLQDSDVMRILSEILSKQSDSKDVRMVNSENIDKIIHSLLSSPCNFTPLLHFVIPVDFLNLKSFAEIWINPNGKEDERFSTVSECEKCIHMLIVFDVEGLGQFEAEIFAEDNKLNMLLLCPSSCVDIFSNVKDEFINSISFSEYYFDEIRVDKLEQTRSLLQVFKSLPYKRTGIDVTI